MIGIFIAICACIYFFMEARKRGQSGAKWSVVAFVGFFAPQVVIVWIILPFVLGGLNIPLEDSVGIQIACAIAVLVVGFCVLIAVRKSLYRFPRMVPEEGVVLVKEIDVFENADGTFTIADKTFDTRSEADQYAVFLKGLK